MNRKQKIIVSITGIILVSLILIGLTYAYFLTKITGNTNSKSISVTTANLELVYGDGNGILAPTEKLMPGDTVGTKEFTVTNNGNNKVEGYLVIFRDVTNTLLRPEDLVYKVECKQYLNDVETGTCDGVEYETQLPTGTGSGSGVIVSNDIDAGYVQKYSLTLKYLEPNVDQSEDMGKNIEAKIDIMDVKMLNSKNGITNYASNTLAGTIINNAMLAKSSDEEKGTAILRGKPITKPGIESSSEKDSELLLDDKTDVSIAANTDYYYTYGDSYEFDGIEGKVKIYNRDGSALKAVQYSKGYEELKGKYLVSLRGASDPTPLKSDFRKMNRTTIGINQVLNNTDSTTIYYSRTDYLFKPKNKENTLSVTSDEEGISYYFRGNVKNNYVEFDDKCWRIVRIEGDGSIRLILSAQKFCNQITEEDIVSGLITEYDDEKNISQSVGYSVDKNGLFSYDNYIEVEQGLPSLKDIINTFGNGGSIIFYEGEENETKVIYPGFGEENKNYLKETSMCLSSNDSKHYVSVEKADESDISRRFYLTTNNAYFNTTGNRLFLDKVYSYFCDKKSEKSKYYTLSIDEAIYAGYGFGGKNKISSSLNYLSDNAYDNYYLSNDIGVNIVSSVYSKINNNKVYNNNIGYRIEEVYENNRNGVYVRPMVTIKNNVIITGGNGTKENPYEVD